MNILVYMVVELAEAAAGGHDFMDETVIATSNVAEQSGNIDWNFDLPNQSNQGLTGKWLLF